MAAEIQTEELIANLRQSAQDLPRLFPDGTPEASCDTVDAAAWRLERAADLLEELTGRGGAVEGSVEQHPDEMRPTVVASAIAEAYLQGRADQAEELLAIGEAARNAARRRRPR